MSRTYRKRDFQFALDQIESDEKIKNYIIKTHDTDFEIEYYFSPPTTLRRRQEELEKTNLSKEDLLRHTIDLVEDNIKNGVRYLRLIQGDRNSWNGCVNRLTKEYCNMKYRSGKKQLINKIMQNVDLNDLDKIDDLNYFKVPNLGAIKGARWCFD